MGRLVTLITVFFIFAAVSFGSVVFVAGQVMSARAASQPAAVPVLRASAPMS